MTIELERGEIVLGADKYKNSSNRRPFLIVSNKEYPFYPYGYLGIPVTTNDRENTFQICENDIVEVTEELHVKPSYINPWSPSQVNKIDKRIVKLSDEFVDRLTDRVSIAMGLGG